MFDIFRHFLYVIEKILETIILLPLGSLWQGTSGRFASLVLPEVQKPNLRSRCFRIKSEMQVLESTAYPFALWKQWRSPYGYKLQGRRVNVEQTCWKAPVEFKTRIFLVEFLFEKI